MTRNFFLTALAVGLLAVVTPPGNADAQVISIGRGGVQYNGYGRGYYGGYGPAQGARVRIYSGYGNGPYGYGGGYGYGNGNYSNGNGYSYGYDNGYGRSGYYVQPGRTFYRQFDGGPYGNYGYGW